MLEPFGNGNLRGGGVRAPGGRGAGAEGLRGGLPFSPLISRTGGGGGGRRVGCQPLFPPRELRERARRRRDLGRPGARVCGCVGVWVRGVGACFSERHFLRRAGDSTPLSSPSHRLPCSFLQEVPRRGARLREAWVRGGTRGAPPASSCRPLPRVRAGAGGGWISPEFSIPSRLLTQARWTSRTFQVS